MTPCSFDLNLLKVAVALADTASVTRAAVELNMSQPGVSTALARLRTQVGDPLFVRTSRGMEPTARGAVVVAEARDVLNRVARHVLSSPEFTAASSRTEFRFAMADVAQMLFMPRLLRALAQEAPHATVHIGSHQPARLEAAMEAGAVDLAVGYFPELTGSNLIQQRLFMHGFCCLVRAGHRFARGLSASQFCELDHVVVQAPVHSQEMGERYFVQHRIPRRIRMRTSNFATLPVILAESDMIATVPAALGTVLPRVSAIAAVATPFAMPRFQVRQHWHRRFDKDQRNMWLRALVARLFGAGSDFLA